MTTNTDGAMPELPDNDIDGEEIGKIIADCTVTFEGGFSHLDNDMFASVIRSAMEDYARAAIEQAAGAVPEGWKLVPVEPTQEMQHAGGRRKYAWENGGGAGTAHAYAYFDETIKRSESGEHCALGMYRAMLSASPAPPKQQPVHLGGGEGGGVPLSDERLLVSFLRNTSVFHQSDTPEWLYARDGDGNSASVRASEIVSAIRNIIKEHS